MRISIFVFCLGVFALPAGAAPDATLQADNQAVNAACATDSATAGCAGEVVGKGLLRCLHAYKKSNPSYKFSPACKSAMLKRHVDKKAGK